MTGGTVIGRERRKLALAGVVALLALVPGLLGDSRAHARGVSFILDPVASFNQPIDVRQAPGEPDLLFVAEKGGRVRVMENGVISPTPFLSITNRVASGGEEGLLSLAFHPNYQQNRRLYVLYVNQRPGHDIQVDQFKVRKSDPTRANHRKRRKVIVVQHNQADNHNGGQLQFEPGTNDLYISVGDGGPQGDPENDAQDPTSLLGKLLRITPRGRGYDVPGDNPYAGSPGRKQVYALGLRNPFRFSFDSQNGALTAGDVGGTQWEEVNYVADPAPGLNFGWQDFEGTNATGFSIPPAASPHTPPVHEYPNGAGPDAVTGGYVVRDPDLPALAGQYLFADFFDGDLLTIQVPAGTAGTPVGLNLPNLAAFGEGLGGQIYVASLNGQVSALEPGP